MIDKHVRQISNLTKKVAAATRESPSAVPVSRAHLLYPRVSVCGTWPLGPHSFMSRSCCTREAHLLLESARLWCLSLRWLLIGFKRGPAATRKSPSAVRTYRAALLLSLLFLFYEVGLAVIREAMSAVITVRALLRLWLLSCATRLAQLLFAKVRLRHVPFGPSYIHGPVLVLQGRSMGRWGPRAGRERTGSWGNCQAGTRYGGRARHAAGHGCSRFRQKRLLNTLICCNTTASTADFW